jgi:hypothetical protein
MNPYHHAVSSQHEHGGTAADYQLIHNWFDQSKSSLAFFTHRSVNHHREGIQEAIRLFGATIVNADGVAVSVETLALQHIAEDCAFIPSAADWLHHMELPLTGGPIRLPATAPSAAELAAASARHFNTDPAAMYPLHSWFLETASWFEDARHFAMKHHSYGIFKAEQHFGFVIAQDSPCPIPTRVAGEWHVRTIMGRIPATADFLRRIKGQPWMAAAHKAHRRGLC